MVTAVLLALACGTPAPAPVIDRSRPTVEVTIVAPGTPPDVVERRITAPAEALLGEISGVEGVSSSSEDSLSTLTVTFVAGTEPGRAVRSVEERVRSPILGLPAGTEIRIE